MWRRHRLPWLRDSDLADVCPQAQGARKSLHIPRLQRLSETLIGAGSRSWHPRPDVAGVSIGIRKGEALRRILGNCLGFEIVSFLEDICACTQALERIPNPEDLPQGLADVAAWTPAASPAKDLDWRRRFVRQGLKSQPRNRTKTMLSLVAGFCRCPRSHGMRCTQDDISKKIGCKRSCEKTGGSMMLKTHMYQQLYTRRLLSPTYEEDWSRKARRRRRTHVLLM